MCIWREFGKFVGWVGVVLVEVILFMWVIEFIMDIFFSYGFIDLGDMWWLFIVSGEFVYFCFLWKVGYWMVYLDELDLVFFLWMYFVYEKE